MAHYVMSDIHGEGFYAMLEKIQFSSEDALYILGMWLTVGQKELAC